MDFNEAFQPAGGTTGRSLVLFEEGASEAGMQAVQEAVGVQVVAASGEEATPAEGGGFLFESLGVAVVDAPPDQVMQAAGSAAILAVEPERIVYALETAETTSQATNGHAGLPLAASPPLPVAQSPQGGGLSADYLRGYREAVLHLTDAVAAPGSAAAVAAQIAAVDESQATWGLQATKVVNCCRTRRGHPRRGARHRLRPRASRLRGTLGHLAVVHHRRGGPGRARARNALHRHRAGREVPRRAAALRGRPRRRDLRGQGALERRLGLGHRDPRGDRVGGAERVRRDLDVARRRHAARASRSRRCSSGSRGARRSRAR